MVLAFDIRASPAALVSTESSLCVTVNEEVQTTVHVVLREFARVESIKIVGIAKSVQCVLVSVAESDDNPEWHAVATASIFHDSSTVLKLDSVNSLVASLQIKLESRPAQVMGFKSLEISGVGMGTKKPRSMHVVPIPKVSPIDTLTSKLIAELRVKSFLLFSKNKFDSSDSLTLIINQLEDVGNEIFRGVPAEDKRLRLAAKAQAITPIRWFDEQFLFPGSPDNSGLSNAFKQTMQRIADNDAMKMLMEENDQLRAIIDRDDIRKADEEVISKEVPPEEVKVSEIKVPKVPKLKHWQKKVKPKQTQGDEEVKVQRRGSPSPVLRGWSHAWDVDLAGTFNDEDVES